MTPYSALERPVEDLAACCSGCRLLTSRSAWSAAQLKHRLVGRALELVVMLGCVFAFDTAAFEGRVVEKDTGKPLGSAFVFATWEGHVAMLVQGRTVCYHAETTTADASGRFRVSDSPNVNPGIIDRQRTIWFYKPGYRMVDSNPDESVIYAERRGSNKSQEFGSVEGTLGPLYACDIDRETLLPVLKVLYEELKPLASTPREMDTMKTYARNIEYLERQTSGAKDKARKGLAGVAPADPRSFDEVNQQIEACNARRDPGERSQCLERVARAAALLAKATACQMAQLKLAAACDPRPGYNPMSKLCPEAQEDIKQNCF